MRSNRFLCALAAAGLLTVGCVFPAKAESTSFSLEPIEPSYSVSVPDGITLSRDPGVSKPVTIRAASVSGLPEGRYISVTVQSIRDGAGQSAETLYLCDDQGEGKVPMVLTTADGIAVDPNAGLLGLELAAFTEAGAATYCVALEREADDQIDYRSTVLTYGIGLADCQ